MDTPAPAPTSHALGIRFCWIAFSRGYLTYDDWMESYTSLGLIFVSRDAVIEFVYSSLPNPSVNIGDDGSCGCGCDVGCSLAAMDTDGRSRD